MIFWNISDIKRAADEFAANHSFNVNFYHHEFIHVITGLSVSPIDEVVATTVEYKWRMFILYGEDVSDAGIVEQIKCAERFLIDKSEEWGYTLPTDYVDVILKSHHEAYSKFFHTVIITPNGLKDLLVDTNPAQLDKWCEVA
jgi:hypothetical protein